MKAKSYVYGQWVEGKSEGAPVSNAVTGEVICHVNSEGVDFNKVVSYGRDKGGAALRAMTIHERAEALKALALHLMSKKEHFYQVSSWTGATKADSWVDIEGGIGTVLSYSSMARRELANETFLVEGKTDVLSSKGNFVARHILTSKPGVSVHINAFNFPCWGMLEKIAPSLIAGVPVVVKPATVSAYLTEAMVQEIVASNILPEGAIQLICGGVGDLLDQLNEQDSVTFTGSASTGRKLKTHSNIIANSIPFNMEADSLNCSILGLSVTQEDPEFDLFIKELVREMTTKAGQKCTAIRRAIVPANRIDDVISALKARLAKVAIGDPTAEGVRMGSLVGLSQREDVKANVARLAQECEVVLGGNDAEFSVVNADAQSGAFYPPTLLLCKNPKNSAAPHEIEAFGPVCTLMPYDTIEDAVHIANLGKGSLVGSIVTYDDQEATQFILNAASYHGRMLVLNRDCAKESTGHGSPLAQLVHGGPGRAGGGEELGGIRAIKHYMQRTAIQGSPTTLMAITKEYIAGARTYTDDKHPFKKYFEELQIGESLTTHRRTVTEADVVSFGCVSGDHFYAHFDEIAAKDSLFGKRVAHGYFIISAAAGMFVEPSPGPVLANYGLENLRFVSPVGIGDTIQVKITAKQKIKKTKRPDEDKATGVVVWDVQVFNQDGEMVALYDIMTLVVRKDA
ncbi:phenylacetic acid degradation bifunctional protein PaaZ [Paraglaciecola chathamensis]|jgi:oxepin-CoA hydrolase/3-oxo-5,6-dehydrosuberyl-CoA semialdehyde dehydrogenase|uniref:3,4-dehydroadipyl-CoA semialdehyde dehydrogenase n=1 Tax=Paraglaciecola agarilytica NO2 TaxID=1125747 RepID=A0ABQ0IAX5_9ALTE|nr:phenylacetic acid degradation bifunctional protein PaaZ [Paraglaciecola agarilytica]GAC06194.1 3,4-dehydroadipyl-CoA semialdehyde dehydrogenase [Paraglaciecola agarilytica NO2]